MVSTSYGTSFYYSTLDALEQASAMPGCTHPDYRAYKPDWDKIRTVMDGERRVKEKGQMYLPPMGDKVGAAYDNYKDRAVFTNYTTRAINGMVGMVLARPVETINGNPEVTKILGRLTADGQDLQVMGKQSVRELLSVGRYGLLVDKDPAGRQPAYLSFYLAENILAWVTEKRDGVDVPTYVLLRELYETIGVSDLGVIVYGSKDDFTASNPTIRARYRILRLDDTNQYEQIVFELKPGATALSPAQTDSVARYKPEHNGKRLDYIPFVCAGMEGLSFKVSRPTAIDIADLNVHHYRTSAQLEHGRFYTAIPVYYVPVSASGNETAEYVVDPSQVWEVSENSKPGILEYYGTGLGALKASMDEKVAAIDRLSGLTAGGAGGTGGSENADVYKAKQAADLALLISAADTTSLALTKALNWICTWENIKTKNLEVKVNQSFKNAVAARELRAVALLYEKGMLPIDEVFVLFRDNGYIHPETTIEKFKAQLDDAKQFPNNPDVKARREGYPDARAKMDDANKNRELDLNETAQEDSRIAAENALKAAQEVPPSADPPVD